jgi:hypothetical protein
MAKWPFVTLRWHIRIATKSERGTSAEAPLTTIPSHHTTWFWPHWSQVMPTVLAHPKIQQLLTWSEPGTRIVVQRQWRLWSRRRPDRQPHTRGTREYKIVDHKLKRVWKKDDPWWDW